MLRYLARRKQREPDRVRLVSTEQLRRTLRRERERSDRTHRCFCFLTIELLRGKIDEATLQKFDWIADQRLRITDDAGIWEPGKLGIILPETPPRGAWRVADEIVSRLDLSLESIRCVVYAYQVDDDESDRPFRPLEEMFEEPVPAWKRAVDVAGSLLGMIALAPLLLLVAVIIRCTSRGPIIFCQDRAGQGGRPFRMYKFRTMVFDAERKKAALRALSEQDGPAFKIANDPRLTFAGRFLRATSIDELPQLWNVLRGEMTLVGPRPLPCDESVELEPWHRRRLDVTPGLTCIWQVGGRSAVSFDDWMRMDIRYSRRRRFWTDAVLMLRTIVAVTLRTGR